jgi:MSHA biogenesis protein MshI
MRWFRASLRQPGWLALSMDGGVLSYAHARWDAGRPAVSLLRRAGDLEEATPERMARDIRADRYACTTLLHSGEYQILAVEAPAVPPDELKAAVRWRVKDMIDFRIEDAVIDVLDIPGEGDTDRPRSRPVYAIAARNDVIRRRIGEFEAARIPVSVIEVPETAQRNVSALFESHGRGLVLLHLDEQSGLLTITYRGELYFTRRIEIGLSQLRAAGPEARSELCMRIMLELQRTFDHFDRQFSFVPLAQLLLGPEPEDTGLLEHLRENLEMPVARLDLASAIDFPEGAMSDVMTQWGLFHLIGAALRDESRAY